MKAARVIHVISFVVAESIYLGNLVVTAMKSPDLVARVISAPLAPINLFLVLALAAIAVLLWPWCGRVARFVAGDAEIR